MLQYVDTLRASGMEVDVSSLLGDDYVAGLYAGKVSIADVARFYLKRICTLFSIRRYDLVWVEKELFPWWPALFELAMVPKRTMLVVDYDDAVFHRYDVHRSRLVRALLGRKIDAVMRRANVVIAGNDYLARRAVKAGCKRVEWIPTVIDLNRYPDTFKKTEGGTRITIGWIGSPSTASYLKMLAPVLSELSTVYNIRCVAIGARADQLLDTPFEAIEWTEDSEVELLQQLDIGIMPLQDAPWERGKCGYKLIQYMACSLPVVASPVGVNCDIVRSGETGYLAADGSEWRDSLNALARDPVLRTAMGKKGRIDVECVFSLQAQVPRLTEIFRTVAGRSDI
jgi:glycosyltransferase involved in cell wall biosynthesis